MYFPGWVLLGCVSHFSVIVRSALQVYGEKLIRKRGGSREMKGNSPRESSTEKPEGREEAKMEKLKELL